MASERILEKHFADAVEEMDIVHIGFLRYVERASHTVRSQRRHHRVNSHDLSDEPDDEDSFSSLRVRQIASRKPRAPPRRIPVKCILRDYGVLEVPFFASSLRLRNAGIRADERNLTFEITERSAGVGGFSSTLVAEARDEHEFTAWNTAFQEIQFRDIDTIYSAFPHMKISEGSNGSIYFGQASDPGNSHIAVKIISRETTPAPALVESFVGHRLMVIQASMYPDSLVSCRQVFHTPKETHLIMEYIQGPTLHDWLKKNGTMSDMDAYRVFDQVMHAVHYLHSLGILHGSICTRSVLLCDKDPAVIDRVKLIDFSMTSMKTEPNSDKFYPERSLEEIKRSVRRNGFQCIPPEIWDSSSASLSSDFWALGCLLYEMLIGPLPIAETVGEPWQHTGNKKRSKLQQYSELRRVDRMQDALFPSDCEAAARITPDARSILFQLLRPEPDRRLNANSVDRHPWLALSRGDPEGQGPTSFWPEGLM